ncbi:protein SODIUM POTASSIUM ROOT DEFECTIVE 1-like [Diospyros lotus]|uniref:protein SODIUM POTASSIUM ROOT DEFECTIVE 1-like n=1 Tax=Diospyros lotus TaxID=55363 RepID=UPI00225BDFC8|nr:protein SODIUM POTASSIUM ROOT DEFECTIVE 1-like [Diospyros lotus]
MKGIDFSCASPASTAICSSLDQAAMVRHGTRPVSRHGHHLDGWRKGLNHAPCTSQLPFDPKPYYQKNRRSSAKQGEPRRNSSADVSNLASPPGSSRYLLSDSPFLDLLSDSDHSKALVPSQCSTRPRHMSSNHSPCFKSSSTNSRHSDHDKALVIPSHRQLHSNDSPSLTSSTPRQRQLHSIDSPSLKSSTPRQRQLRSIESPSLKSSTTHPRPHDQVVELRVSIHCKGCEGKVRKHISRMEGVTSFSIDLASKKVTIIGNVTPLGVLTSISKVKYAQFWPSPTSSSLLSP